MRNLLLATTCACLLGILTAACGGEDSSSSQQQPGGTITGRERLGWDQQAPDANELGQYSYVLYVDGRAVDLSGVACGALSGPGPVAACSSSLPPLQNGQHSLELATRVPRDGEMVESVRSAPLVVTVAASASSASAPLTASTSELRVSSIAPPSVEMVVAGLDRPSALAALPDGRLLIAERGGRIRIADGGQLQEAFALELHDADNGDHAAVSLAIARDFASTRQVYVGYTARDAGGALTGRVVRYREVGGTLGEAAVVIDGLPGQAGAPRVRIGPDDAVYVATAALDTRDAADLSSYAGKILRLSSDGRTPPGNPVSTSPMFSYGYRSLLGFDWDGESGTLWYIDSDGEGTTLGRLDSGRRPESIADLGRVRAVDIACDSVNWPASWHGSVFLASPDGEGLYRVAGLASSPPEPVIDRLFAARFSRISAVISGPDGLYFAAWNDGPGAAGTAGGAVYRVREWLP